MELSLYGFIHILSVYLYCLGFRCGDSNAASTILKQFGNVSVSSDDMSAVDPQVVELVSQLAQMQKDNDTIFGDSTNGNARPVQQLQSSLLSPGNSIVQNRRAVWDLYERTKTRNPSLSAAEPFVAYRAACLALLGGSESISESASLESSGIVKTVEDYLYASLWYAVLLADTSSDGGIGGLKKTSEAVARLGGLIKQWGPSYFEQDDASDNQYSSAASAVAMATQGGVSKSIPRSGGWAYSLPLMASQQYATAMASLADVGGGLGLLQATHVAVVGDAAGLPLNDFILDEHSSSNASQVLLPMLVCSYSASLQGSNVAAAVKYLMLLCGKGKLVKEQIQRLLLETRQFEALAGTVRGDGSRSNGALDEYFSKKEVSSLLAETAGDAIRAGKAADAAELLVLAGKYDALFSLMNRELASYLVVSTEEEFKKRQ